MNMAWLFGYTQAPTVLSLVEEANENLSEDRHEKYYVKPFPSALEAIHRSKEVKFLLELHALNLKTRESIERAIDFAAIWLSNIFEEGVPACFADQRDLISFIKKVCLAVKRQGLFLQPLFPSVGLEAQDLAPKILSHLDSQYNAFVESVPAGLNALACTSKSWNMAVQQSYLNYLEKHLFVKEQLCSFSKCKTVKDAIQLIEKRKLEVANLEKLKNVTAGEIDLLLKGCPYIKHLIIRSDQLQQLPESCCQLETLECIGCKFLTCLPHNLTNLTSLKCTSCPALVNLPESLENLIRLECFDCKRLTSLPNCLIKLKYLNCASCNELKSLPECLTQLQYLDCGACRQLKALPECLGQLKFLNCSFCCQLESLPDDLMQLLGLDCQCCDNLIKLPKNMPKLKSLVRDGSPLLENYEHYLEVKEATNGCLLM